MGQKSSQPQTTKFSKLQYDENENTTEKKENDNNDHDKGDKHYPEKTKIETMKKHFQMVNSSKEDFQDGNILFRNTQYTEAMEKYSSALTKLKYCDDNDCCSEKLIILSNIGVLEFAIGRYEEAKNLLNQALWTFKNCKDEMNEELIKNFNFTSLSIALKKDIVFHRLPDSQKILTSILQEHSSIDSLVADILNNLGACNEVTGHLEEAHNLYNESLNLRKVTFGENSLKVAESLQNLATVLDSQGKLNEAYDLLLKALVIEEKEHGMNSINTAVSLNNLGVLLAHLGRLPESEDLLKRSYDIRYQVYGEYHHLTICAKNNLNYIKNKMNSLEDTCRDFHINNCKETYIDEQSVSDSTLYHHRNIQQEYED